jgi:hypothetical protein
MKIMILTNNLDVAVKYKDVYKVEYMDCSYRGVLKATRDLVHMGYKLLTHPLSGSVKPNETPYKTILLRDEVDSLDMDSLDIIEKSLEVADKFTYSDHAIAEEILEDFRCIDSSLIGNVISKLY